MLSNNGLCVCAAAQYVTIFSNSLIIPTAFKFTELHTLTLAARSYVLLNSGSPWNIAAVLEWCRCSSVRLVMEFKINNTSNWITKAWNEATIYLQSRNHSQTYGCLNSCTPFFSRWVGTRTSSRRPSTSAVTTMSTTCIWCPRRNTCY